MTKSPKTADTPRRVLETLKLLYKNDCTVDDLIKHLSLHCQAIYTAEAILKYLNTLRVAGLGVKKIGNKYSLMNHPCAIDFDESDLRILNLIESFANAMPEKATKTEISAFTNSLKKRFSQTHQENTDKFSFELPEIKNLNAVENLEKYCTEKLKLKINYLKNNEPTQIVVEPKEIKYKNGGIFLKTYDTTNAKIQDINIDNMIEISQLPLRSNEKMLPLTTTFKLKSGLAKNYKLRDWERLTLKEQNGDLIITNTNEDSDELIQRLFKYGQNCEVISPKDAKTQMIKLLDDMISRYQ